MDRGTVTVRVIKSLQYKNYRALVFRDVDLRATTLGGLHALVRARIDATPGLAQYRPVALDTWKTYYHKFGAKTSNPMINVPARDAGPEAARADMALFLVDREASLWDLGVRDETELSLFPRTDYDAYVESPSLIWE